MTEDHAKSALNELNVSRETLELVERYVELLNEWRQKINLIGPREMDHIWFRHVLDSAQLIPMTGPGASIIDLGSGAGFPGLILACHAKQAGGQVSMVESVGKKCAFLMDVVSKLQLPAHVENRRVEALTPKSVDFVTARAFAPLPKLLDYSEPWLSRGATGLFFKGERWREELTDAQECWTLAYEAIPSRTSQTGVILKIKEAHRV
ncbi:16S rRNA (guanine(527)-N(7))-methyltransferase RsmG [Henriciella sp. AS95]|uniref:16S rRNA (guanine(527)-N(7))-methyltransferase RsmG n=1 Tax=Henriciella sp. AS95 TaxID=3135782 RepID=UPI00316C474E